MPSLCTFVGTTIASVRIVLYRTTDGTPAALDDRRPHRWAPLSQGRVEGGESICPCHGMAYGTDGTCTRIPTQSDIPGGARVRSYPLRESGAFEPQSPANAISRPQTSAPSQQTVERMA